jgi:hypothetical protein
MLHVFPEWQIVLSKLLTLVIKISLLSLEPYMSGVLAMSLLPVFIAPELI